MLDPYFELRGLDVSLTMLLDNYQELDKNKIRDLRDRELLPLLGIPVL